MAFNEKKYTEEAILEELALMERHARDGSAVDAGCSCIEEKHTLAISGLASEATLMEGSQKEKDFYQKIAEFNKKVRHEIIDGTFNFPHNPLTAAYPTSAAYYKKHPIKMPPLVKRKLHWGERIKQNPDNPYPRKYLPHGLTSCEKEHPKVVRKLGSCIKKVEKREGCTPPYTDCPVNPVAVCRASVKCP